jgi:uroporphyrin-III C-methyltransferase/precorrin-2 dehydrogenase/sirohydrochlorin ferrochelatase
VWIVGAGPGSPDLLTRRAAACLRKADLVLYDALVDKSVLKVARRAQRFFVGKRAGRHALTQPEIHALMIRAARRGKRVVRLKGGDPFVFGRGGEEVQALQAAGIPFEVVPGVTSAFAAPALAGIPVTHRGLSSAVLVVSGHDEALFERLVGEVRPENVTLVVLMGRSRRDALARILVERGWPGTTSAAIVADASRSDQHVWRGTLEDLSRGDGALDTDGPVTLVIGETASLALSAEDIGSMPARALSGDRRG